MKPPSFQTYLGELLHEGKAPDLQPYHAELLREWDSYCEGTMPERKAAHFRERMDHAGLVATLSDT